MTTEDQPTSTIEYQPFVVGDRPVCAWGFDLDERNVHFLSRLDPDYYRFMAAVLGKQLDGPHSHAAALALRNTYHHGLETLFAMLIGALQAPNCLLGWLHQYKNQQLRDLIADISKGTCTIRNRFGDSARSWQSVADLVLRYAQFGSQEATHRTRAAFGTLWTRFASDVLDEIVADEYRSIKHGLRATSGGATIYVGTETQPGVPAPPEAMGCLGGSVHGSTFQQLTKLKASPRNAYNFYFTRQTLNWNPKSVATALTLISVSLANIIAFLKLENGVPPTEVKFFKPPDEAFEAPWNNLPTVLHSSMDFHIPEEHLEPMSAQDILDSYKPE